MMVLESGGEQERSHGSRSIRDCFMKEEGVWDFGSSRSTLEVDLWTTGQLLWIRNIITVKEW